MHLVTSNKVNETLEKLKGMNDQIGIYIKNIHQNKFLEESMREERSGFYKIARIIKYNFNVEANYEAGISEKKFVLKIDLPVGLMERR